MDRNPGTRSEAITDRVMKLAGLLPPGYERALASQWSAAKVLRHYAVPCSGGSLRGGGRGFG